VTLGAIESAQKASKIIETTLDRPVSRSTVSRALHSAGLHAKKKLIKPTLTDRHKRLRFEFAKKYENWSISDWEKVIFFDETKINRYGSDGIRWCWKRSGDNRILDHQVVQTYKHGGGSNYVFGPV
jgi:hypothetical protein